MKEYKRLFQKCVEKHWDIEVDVVTNFIKDAGERFSGVDDHADEWMTLKKILI